MRTLYQSKNHWNHYLRPSARAPWWDYGKNGIYFITICTRNRLPLLGNMRKNDMKLSSIGQLAKDFWTRLSREEGVHLDAFVIMPNHIHGILILDRPKGMEPTQANHPNTLNAHPQANNQLDRKAFFQHISPQKGSLPHLIRKFKALVTRQARIQGFLAQDQPLWQARYYDRIVRNDAEMSQLHTHIANNHREWKKDDYYCPTSKPEEEPSNFHHLNKHEEKDSNSQQMALLYKGYQAPSLQGNISSGEFYEFGKGHLLFGQWYNKPYLRGGGKDDMNIVSTDNT